MPTSEPDEELIATLLDEDALYAQLLPEDLLVAQLDDAGELRAQIAEEQGMRGPPGPSGVQGERGAPGHDGAPGGALVRVAGAPIGGGRCVRSLGPDLVIAASALLTADASAVLGVCVAGATGGEDVTVVRLGLVEDSGWSLTPGEPVFCGPQGELVQHADFAWAFWRQVGVAVDATHVFVDLEPPILVGEE